MSWDVYIMSASGAGGMAPGADPNDEDIAPLGIRETVHSAIRSVFPTVDLSDRSWGVLEGEGYTIEFNMGTDDSVGGMMLHVRGGGDVIPAIKALCDHTGWLAYDLQAGEFMAFDAASEESWQEWQAFRDRAVGSSESKDQV